MSQDDDLHFSSSESLVMSDFSGLTELDDFQKDLFMGNTMEGITGRVLLEELDCKDDLKLISEVNDVFEASMKVGGDDGKDSIKGPDSSLSLLVDTWSSGSLQFLSMTSQLDLETVSSDIDMKSIGLIHTLSNSSTDSTAQSDLPSHTAIVASNEMNCTSLDELEQLAPAQHGTETMCVFPSPLIFKQGVNLPTSNEELHLSSIAPSQLQGKDMVGSRMFKVDAQTQGPEDMASSPVQLRAVGRSSTSLFSKSDTSSLSDMRSTSDDGCNVQTLRSVPVQCGSVHSKEVSTTCGMFGKPIPDVPSLQRSQSSNSLDHLRMSCGLGVCTDDVQTQPVCKQELPLLLTATGMSFYALPPYQASTSQSLAPMRRVYSTGDLQVFDGMQRLYGIKSENSIPEDAASIRIGHYTMEERRMKLHRYRQKRTERNFSKKIKYACRKTLADNRPRVRGRFARSDEMGDSGFQGTDLPLISEYEAFTSHRLHPQGTRDQQTYFVVNNSCVMPNTAITQFWSTMGMKVAM